MARIAPPIHAAADCDGLLFTLNNLEDFVR
jgi:hypothetical protein